MDSNIQEIIEKSNNVLVIISGPDQDALGSGVVLRNILQKQGKNNNLICREPLNKKLSELELSKEVKIEEPALVDYGKYDLVMIVDAGDMGQIVGKKYATSFKFPDNIEVISIDHHKEHGDFASHNILDPDATSTCELIFSLFVENKYTLSTDEANILLVGLIFDTWYFKWRNVERAHILAAKLIKAGANNDYVTNYFEFSRELKYHELLKYILPKVEFHEDLTLMLLVLTKEDIKNLNIDRNELSSLMEDYKNSYSRTFKGYNIGVVFTENEDSSIKISLRGNNLLNKLDTSQFSKFFEDADGGGHFQASALTVRGLSMDECISIFLEKIKQELSKVWKK